VLLESKEVTKMLAYQKQNALKFILMNVDNCTEWKWNQLLICILEEQV